jgi:F0F1-type ATP synthase assembly protein I
VRNSVQSGRRLAARVFTTQVAASAVVALAWLAAGSREALGALLGGLAVALGTGLFALRYFRGAEPAGSVLARFAGATALKWVVAIALLYLAIGVLALPAPAVGTGLLAGLATSVWALKFAD